LISISKSYTLSPYSSSSINVLGLILNDGTDEFPAVGTDEFPAVGTVPVRGGPGTLLGMGCVLVSLVGFGGRHGQGQALCAVLIAGVFCTNSIMILV
jgi:hypothetical protein